MTYISPTEVTNRKFSASTVINKVNCARKESAYSGSCLFTNLDSTTSLLFTQFHVSTIQTLPGTALSNACVGLNKNTATREWN